MPPMFCFRTISMEAVCFPRWNRWKIEILDASVLKDGTSQPSLHLERSTQQLGSLNVLRPYELNMDHTCFTAR